MNSEIMKNTSLIIATVLTITCAACKEKDWAKKSRSLHLPIAAPCCLYVFAMIQNLGCRNFADATFMLISESPISFALHRHHFTILFLMYTAWLKF